MPIVLSAYPQDWPQPWLDEYQERASIMLAEDVPDAERKAEAEVRRVAAQEGQAGLFA